MKIKLNEVLILLVFTILIISTILIPYLSFKDWDIRGQFGDMFNVVNSIAGLLGTIVAIYTLIFYGREISNQNRSLSETQKRQLNIEENLLNISRTLGLLQENNNISLRIKSIIELIELKKEEIFYSKKSNEALSKINRLEKELNNLKKELNNNLKKI